MTTKRESKRILSVRIIREIDTDPDTSWLGEYASQPCGEFSIDRKVSSCNGGGYDMKGTALGNFIARAFSAELLKLKPAQMPEQSHWEPERSRHCADKCLDAYSERYADAIAARTPLADVKPLPKLSEDTWECPDCKGKTRQSHDGKRIDDGRYFYGLRFHDPNYDPLAAKLERCDDTFTKPEDVGKTFRQLQKEGKIVALDALRTWYKASSPHPTRRHTVEKILEAVGYQLEYITGGRRSKNDVYKLRKMARKRHGNTGKRLKAA
jgi:hypothetical protein